MAAPMPHEAPVTPTVVAPSFMVIAARRGARTRLRGRARRAVVVVAESMRASRSRDIAGLRLLQGIDAAASYESE